MAKSTYVSLKDEVSVDLFEITPYQENQTSMKSPRSLKILLGWLILLLMLVCGLCFMIRPHNDTTQNNTEEKSNLSLRTLGTRFVPLELHNIYRSHVVRDQVMRNHSHLSLNDSMSHQSSSDQKVRVKRQPFLPPGMSGILYLITSTSRPSTVTPWIEPYNETHNIVQNYTFRHIVKATDEREDIISLDYSKDLHTWHTEKYSRCKS